MNELLEHLHRKGFAVMLWKNKARGWLACLLDDRLERVADSTTWDYHPTPESAVAQLCADNAAFEVKSRFVEERTGK